MGTITQGLYRKPQTETFAAIYESMLQSPTYKDLTPRQQQLYLLCKAQFRGKRKPEKDFKDIEFVQGDDKFYFNWDLAKRYGLYKPTCSKNFYNDMNELIAHGFIERISSGKAHRTKSIYQYSDKWQVWKPPDTA